MLPRYTLITLAVLLFAIACSAQDWRPVTPAELAAASSQIEPDADSEVLYLEVRSEDSYDRREGYKAVVEHYLKIKIYTDRGREDNAKVGIPFGNIPSVGSRISVSDISARTTAPNGSTATLDEKDIFEQEVVKGDGIKVKEKSFVVPGIETGAVVEYRWKEVRHGYASFVKRLEIARSVPVREAKFYLKPGAVPGGELAMRIRSFNTAGSLQKEDGGYYSLSFSNVAAFHSEAYMPPEYDVKPWLLVYYEYDGVDNGVPPEEYWRNFGKETFEVHKSTFKSKKQIREAAEQAIGDATDPLEKVRRISDFCRNKIKNLSDDALGLTDDEREDIKDNKNPSDTLKRMQGYAFDILHLFAAMIDAADMEVRMAKTARRTNPRFDKSLYSSYLLDTEVVAVKINGDWQYFDASLQHLPFGMLPWQLEGEAALISDKKEPFWGTVPRSAPEQSQIRRTARLKLDADGGISGVATVEFTGHGAAINKEALDDDSPSEREKTVAAYVTSRVSPSAAVENIAVENIDDPEKPLVYRMKIAAPNYADKTGRRLFLKANVFANSTKALFSTNTRRNDVFFRYPWSESDEISIEIPAEFDVEIADPPDSIRDSGNLGLYTASVTFDEATRILTYKRSFSFGSGGRLEFSSESYKQVKDLFDSYYKADQHVITLVRKSQQ